MSIPKTLFFIDGENLVFRYQAMCDTGQRPATGIVHIPDIFVWHPKLTQLSYMNISRVYYYTSMVGDDHAMDGVKAAIGTTIYEY